MSEQRRVGLAFVLAPMRSGSTLLRKMLNAHPQLASPPETMFLLPLLGLWTGDAKSERYNVRQAAVALQSVCDRATFVEACRRFASAVYAPLCKPGCACIIDKTPLYLQVAAELPELFPAAKYILLARDPRATTWAYFTWGKAPCESVELAAEITAAYYKRQYEFARMHGAKSLVVHYEALCLEPARECRRLCDFLGVAFDPAMIEYGSVPDARTGYGDDNVRLHRRPHTGSIDRWRGHLDEAQQRILAARCGPEALRFFGHGLAPGAISVAEMAPGAS